MTDAIKAETITIKGAGGDDIEAYFAEPVDGNTHGAMIVIHHLPGYDEGTKEYARRFAANGYLAICPNLYSREAPGMSPDDAAAYVRANGGVSDAQFVGDAGGALEFLRAHPSSNGKVGSIGYCSGGRQSFLAGCNLDLDAVVDCYGAYVVDEPAPDFPVRMTPLLHQTANLSGPLLGLFGEDDLHPSPADVVILEEALKKEGKDFEFHSFEGAGHGFFFVERPAYRPEAAREGWQFIFKFLEKHLSA